MKSSRRYRTASSWVRTSGPGRGGSPGRSTVGATRRDWPLDADVPPIVQWFRWSGTGVKVGAATTEPVAEMTQELTKIGPGGTNERRPGFISRAFFDA